MELSQPADEMAMDHFTCALYGKIRAHRLETIPELGAPEVTWTSGYTYNKVFIGSQLYAFIEKTTGDIFAVASNGETRARTPSGNIHDRDRLKCCGPFHVLRLHRKKTLAKI